MDDGFDVKLENVSQLALPWSPLDVRLGGNAAGWSAALLRDVITVRVPLRDAIAELREKVAALNTMHANMKGAMDGGAAAHTRTESSAKALGQASNDAKEAAKVAAAAEAAVQLAQKDVWSTLAKAEGARKAHEEQATGVEQAAREEMEAADKEADTTARLYEEAQEAVRLAHESCLAAQKATASSFQVPSFLPGDLTPIALSM